MTINRAIEHFEWKFSNKWKPTQKDIEAYNSIVEYYENQRDLNFNSNELFAKIYITFFGELLQYYKTTVFDPSPQKDLHRLLDQPIEVIIEKFVKKANDMEVYCKFKDAGISDKHPMLKTDEEKAKDLERFKLEFLDPVMTYEDAVDNLKAMINNVINKT